MKQLQLTYARHQKSKFAFVLPDQIVRYCDLTLLLRGSMTYFIDGKQIDLHGGDILFVPSGSLRSRRESEELCDYFSFNFITEDAVNLPTCFGEGVDRDVHRLLAPLDALCEHSYNESREVAEHLLAALIVLLEKRIQSSSIHPLTKRILDYIHKNLPERLTLAEIGKECFFSPVYCDTVFKRDMGRSIIDYALDRRVEEAKTMLLEGSLSLTQVAEQVGFDDYNYFARVFKKRTGLSPTSYKKLFFFG